MAEGGRRWDRCGKKAMGREGRKGSGKREDRREKILNSEYHVIR